MWLLVRRRSRLWWRGNSWNFDLTLLFQRTLDIVIGVERRRKTVVSARSSSGLHTGRCHADRQGGRVLVGDCHHKSSVRRPRGNEGIRRAICTWSFRMCRSLVDNGENSCCTGGLWLGCTFSPVSGFTRDRCKSSAYPLLPPSTFGTGGEGSLPGAKRRGRA